MKNMMAIPIVLITDAEIRDMIYKTERGIPLIKDEEDKDEVRD